MFKSRVALVIKRTRNFRKQDESNIERSEGELKRRKQMNTEDIRWDILAKEFLRGF